MKVKRIYSCLFCGIRSGKATSAFCHQDAKRFGVELVPIRLHGTHLFQWSKLIIDSPFGQSISDFMKRPQPSEETK